MSAPRITPAENELPKVGTGAAALFAVPARTPAEPRFRLVPFEQLTPGTEAAYLVKGLIPRVGLTVAWGPPKCGKSFWAFDLAMSVARGVPYRGRRVQGGTVVYCAFEGADGFKARAEAYRIRYLAEDAGVVPFYLSPSPLDLVGDHAALIASIRFYLGDASPALVVLDTLNRSLRGSESDDKDMSAYVRAADAIRDAFGCAVLIVHHCGIDATRPRGHTALAGAVDAQLAVKRDAGGTITVTVERMKDGPEGDTISSALETVEVGTDSDGDTLQSCVIVEAEPSSVSEASRRKLSPKASLALEALAEVILAVGQPAPSSFGLPSHLKAVPLEKWRAEMLSRGVLDPEVIPPWPVPLTPSSPSSATRSVPSPLRWSA